MRQEAVARSFADSPRCRVVFTGKGQAPTVVPDAAAVKKAVAADPKSIGYIDKASVDGSVKVVLMLD